jgi:NADP-dependent 3-hydroxy acid dehydrogenase YdfG
MADEGEKIDQQVIVITGASSGFGRGSAMALAAKGANVVVAARRTEVLDGLVDEIRGAGGSALAVTTDVSQAGEVEALARAAIAKFGRIDVWIAWAIHARSTAAM